jgi:hypothetical protein
MLIQATLIFSTTMLYFSHLRVLTLAATTWLATGCAHKNDAPQPQQLTPIASLSTHTVTVRYQARPLSGATAGLPKNLNLLVEYERVEQTSPTTYRLSAPSVQLHDLAISDTMQQVSLSRLATYPTTLRPKVTVQLWENQELPTLASAPYEITCELVLDEKVVGRTTYAVVAGQLPPLVASSQTEVAP